MKKTIIYMLLFLASYLATAQSIRLSGKIVSLNTNEDLAFVTVVVYEAKTDSVIQQTFTNEKGEYTFSFPFSSFYVKSQLIGYKNYQSNIVNTNTDYELNITLEKDPEELEEIEVYQKKDLVRLTGEKLIIDIEKAGLGDGNDGLETLRKLPGIRLDKDENITFRGNKGVQIMIDGKPVLLTGDELTQFLKTVEGSNITNVEIISNPSAKHDASAMGGILNINLKKHKEDGLNGNAYSSIGYAEFIKNRQGVSVYNNTKKCNVNAGVYYNYSESVNHRKIIQTIENNDKVTTLDQTNDWFPKSNYYTAKLGVSNKLSDNQTIGTSWRYNISTSDETTIGRTNQFYDNKYEEYTILNIDHYIRSSKLSGNTFYTYISDSLDTKLDIQLNYASHNDKNDRLTSNRYFYANDNQYNQLRIDNKNPTQITIFNTLIDLEKTINETISLETGIKHSAVDNDYDIVLKNEKEQNEFIIDTTRSNHFLYNESITAAYAITNFTVKKWNISTGLRAEYINYKAKSITDKKTNKNDYLSFFPSLNLNKASENNQFGFSYSRRIQRPKYLQLNPFFEYIDTYNVSVGNPNLQPQFSNSFELTWLRKYKTSYSLYTTFTTNEIYDIIDYNNTTKITTLSENNIGSSQKIGSSFNTSFTPLEWWEMQLNADIYYTQAKSELENYAFKNNGAGWSASLNQSFALKKDLSITCQSFYSSREQYGNTVFKSAYDISFGIKKELFDKKLKLKLSADNILKKSRWRQVTEQNNITTNWENRWETRKFTFTAIYYFGTGKKKNIKRTNLNDEENRL